jgi:hypothetical protein
LRADLCSRRPTIAIDESAGTVFLHAGSLEDSNGLAADRD